MPSDKTGFHIKRLILNGVFGKGLWRKLAGDFILLHITRVFRLTESIVSGSDCSIMTSFMTLSHQCKLKNMAPPEAPYPYVYTDTFIFSLRSLCKIIWMNVHYFPNAPRILSLIDPLLFPQDCWVSEWVNQPNICICSCSLLKYKLLIQKLIVENDRKK